MERNTLTKKIELVEELADINSTRIDVNEQALERNQEYQETIVRQNWALIMVMLTGFFTLLAVLI